MKVGFCPECFFFGYEKRYNVGTYYNGFGEAVESGSEHLEEVYCANCEEDVIFAELNEDGAGAILEARRIAATERLPLHSEFDIFYCRECAKGFSIAVVILAASGYAEFKKLTVGEEYVPVDTNPEDLLIRAAESEPDALANALKLLLRTKIGDNLKFENSDVLTRLLLHIL